MSQVLEGLQAASFFPTRLPGHFPALWLGRIQKIIFFCFDSLKMTAVSFFLSMNSLLSRKIKLFLLHLPFQVQDGFSLSYPKTIFDIRIMKWNAQIMASSYK